MHMKCPGPLEDPSIVDDFHWLYSDGLIRHIVTGYCLEVVPGVTADTKIPGLEPGPTVEMRPCNKISPLQKWECQFSICCLS